MPARPAAHLAGRAAADVGPAGGRGRRLRGRHQPTRAALGQRPANRCRRARCRPVGRPGRGARERLHRRSRRRDRVPSPIDRQGRRTRPACRSPGRATTRRWPAVSMGPPPRSPGTGCRPTTRSVPGARRSRPPPSRAVVTRRPTSCRPSSSRWPSSPAPAAPVRRGGGRLLRSTGSTSRSAPRRRPSRSGRPPGRRPSSRRRSAGSTPGATGSGSGCSTSGWPRSGERPVTRPGRCTRRAGPSSSSRATPVRSARRSWPGWRSSRCSTASSRRASVSPEKRSRSPVPASRWRVPRRSTPRRRWPSRRPGAAIRPVRSTCCARPSGPPSRWMTRTPCSGSGPT